MNDKAAGSVKILKYFDRECLKRVVVMQNNNNGRYRVSINALDKETLKVYKYEKVFLGDTMMMIVAMVLKLVFGEEVLAKSFAIAAEKKVKELKRMSPRLSN